MTSPFKSSIGTKVFGAFFAIILVMAALGLYGLHVLSASGDIVAYTYDHPLMAINYAHIANLDFVEMDKEELHLKTLPPTANADSNQIDELTANFYGDLDVAEQRALGADEHKTIQRIRALVKNWSEARANSADLPTLDSIAQSINQKFEMLTESTADQSFIERRKAISSIDNFRLSSLGALSVALVLSATISFLLARRIVRPLAAAATIADKIADGELQTPIPQGGSDETGALLRSMTVMQDSIRMMMDREKKQRESAQNRLIDALESSNEGMVLVDAQNRIVIANSQLAEFFPEIIPEDITGSDFTQTFGSLHPQLIEETISEFSLDDDSWIRVSRSTTQDGGFFLFLSDFTELKKREERYKVAMQLAEASNVAKSQFLANMSHELRTPLNAIIGFSEIISGQIFGAINNQRYVGYANDVLQSGRHLLDIINSVLDLAKSQAGKLELHADTLELRKVLDACQTMVSPQVEKGGLELAVDMPDGPLLLDGDTSKLRQIFVNLLSNAIKFTEPGGRIALSVKFTDKDHIDVIISDTGIGMAPEDIPLALAPFGQVDSKLSRRYEGTGLGLPLTKALVDLHGGVLTIDSELGRGTTVTVSLLRLIEEPALTSAVA